MFKPATLFMYLSQVRNLQWLKLLHVCHICVFLNCFWLNKISFDDSSNNCQLVNHIVSSDDLRSIRFYIIQWWKWGRQHKEAIWYHKGICVTNYNRCVSLSIIVTTNPVRSSVYHINDTICQWVPIGHNQHMFAAIEAVSNKEMWVDYQ